jgi:hypothetical protein
VVVAVLEDLRQDLGVHVGLSNEVKMRPGKGAKKGEG